MGKKIGLLNPLLGFNKELQRPSEEDTSSKENSFTSCPGKTPLQNIVTSIIEHKLHRGKLNVKVQFLKPFQVEDANISDPTYESMIQVETLLSCKDGLKHMKGYLAILFYENFRKWIEVVHQFPHLKPDDWLKSSARSYNNRIIANPIGRPKLNSNWFMYCSFVVENDKKREKVERGKNHRKPEKPPKYMLSKPKVDFRHRISCTEIRVTDDRFIDYPIL